MKAAKEGNEIPIPVDIPVHFDFTASDEVKKIITYIKINSLFKREAPPRDQWGIISCSQLAISTRYDT